MCRRDISTCALSRRPGRTGDRSRKAAATPAARQRSWRARPSPRVLPAIRRPYCTCTTRPIARPLRQRGARIDSESVLLAFLPVGLNWGLLNVLQAVFAGCTIVLQEVFDADEALALIERERVTHFCCAPAHLVSLLNVPDLEPLRSLVIASDDYRRRLLPDRGDPRGPGAAARPSARTLRHARMRVPVAHDAR